MSNKEYVVALAYANKVEVASWYASPVHPYIGDELLQTGYQIGSCPNAELSSQHIVSLPLSHKVSNTFLMKLEATFAE